MSVSKTVAQDDRNGDVDDVRWLCVCGWTISRLGQSVIKYSCALRIYFTICDQDRNARLSIFTNLVSAQVESTNQVVTQSTRASVSELTRLMSQRNQAKVHLAQARNLATQLQEGDPSTSASNALALQLLKTLCLCLIQNDPAIGRTRVHGT